MGPILSNGCDTARSSDGLHDGTELQWGPSSRMGVTGGTWNTNDRIPFKLQWGPSSRMGVTRDAGQDGNECLRASMGPILSNGCDA